MAEGIGIIMPALLSQHGLGFKLTITLMRHRGFAQLQGYYWALRKDTGEVTKSHAQHQQSRAHNSQDVPNAHCTLGVCIAMTHDMGWAGPLLGLVPC